MRGNSGHLGAVAPSRLAWAPLLGCLLIATACKQPPTSQYEFDPEAKRRGLAAIERVGCAACHEIPGVTWPKGRTAPSLKGFDDVGVIAGNLPNTPANLAAFVRNAPKAKPGSTMPAMPLTEHEARDVAAYLLGADDA
jgi:cytochrome c1